MRDHPTDPPVASLRVATARGVQHFALAGASITVGRAASNDVCIDARVVSTTHARLERHGDTYRFLQVGQTNPTFADGQVVTDLVLTEGATLMIAPGTPDEVLIVFECESRGIDPATLELTRAFRVNERAGTTARLALPVQGSLTIGRGDTNDLQLESLSVSRLHARVDIEDGRATLSDAGSANGTFVNGVAARNRVLAPGDVIRIGPYKLVYRGDALEHQDDSRAVRLDVHDVTKVVGGRTLLNGVSFTAMPGQVFAIAGTSGAGKSTLIDALNGMRPPTSGRILVNGANLYDAYDALRPLIGYVPQETVLPLPLTVRRALQYVAQLRLPPDLGAADTRSRVHEVMEQLDLAHRGEVQIGQLSGGQQKRASIAAELLARPGLFFLDEPTSGLDPGLARRVTQLIRQLATQGSTIVMVSHNIEELEAADRIVFLGSGGRVVFIGPPADALRYFQVQHLAEIYPLVESEDTAVLARRFIESGYYGQHLAPATPGQEGDPSESQHLAFDPVALISAGSRRGASAWRQFSICTRRYTETLLRDRRNVVLLLAQAPVIALFIALVAKTTDFKPPPDAAITQAAAFGIPAAKLAAALPIMMAATATWFGAINAAREIVKELPILRRERLAGLRVVPYLASKVSVLLVLCLLQTTALLGVIALKVDLPASGALMWGPLELWITLNLAALAALALGLVISASMSNADRAQSLVPIVLIPQLIFLGGPGTGLVGRLLSYLTVTHWSVEAMKISAGIPYQAQTGGYGASDLLLRWLALGVMATVLTLVAGRQLARGRAA